MSHFVDAALGIAILAAAGAGIAVALRSGFAPSAPLLGAALAAGGWLAHSLDTPRLPLLLLVAANVTVLAGAWRRR